MDKLASSETSIFIRCSYLLILGLVVCLLWILSREDFLTFHAIVELFTIFISALIALAGFKAKTTPETRYLRLLSTVFLCVAFIDLAHMLTYKGALLSGDLGPNPPTQFWTLGRLIQAIGLTIVFVCPFQCRHQKAYIRGLIAVSLAGIVSIYPLSVFPDAFVEGSGLTPFKIYSEYLITALVTVAWSAVWFKRRTLNSIHVPFLMASFALTIIAELCFTQYISVYGDANAIGHLFRFVASYFLYRGLFSDKYALRHSVFQINPLHIVIVILSCLIWLTVGVGVRYIEQERQKTDELYLYKQRLQGLVITLQAMLDSELRLTDSLEAFVLARKDFSAEEFSRFANRIEQKSSFVSSLQLAPGGVVKYVTNPERNKKAIGHNLLQDAKRKQGVMDAITKRRTIVDGPLQLIQGGYALIARTPIYLPARSEHQQSEFWGFATVLIDLDAMFRSPILTRFADEFVLSIEAVNPIGSVDNIIFGEASDQQAPLLQQRLSLNNSYWKFSMYGGRNISVQHSSFILSSWYWTYLVLSTGLIGVALLRILGHKVYVKKAVIDATEHLQQEVERRQQLAEMERLLATRDELTGLANRRHFYQLAHQQVDTAREQGRSFTMYYMDLDGFKAVNDTYGHTVGDRVLTLVGERLKRSLRASDIIARLGGDEFVAILPDAQDYDFIKSQQIIAGVGEEMIIGELSIKIGISIGAAVFPNHGTTVEALLLQADRALYQAKDQGKNQLVVAGA